MIFQRNTQEKCLKKIGNNCLIQKNCVEAFLRFSKKGTNNAAGLIVVLTRGKNSAMKNMHVSWFFCTIPSKPLKKSALIYNKYSKFVYFFRFLDQSEPRRGDFYRPNLKETTPTQMNEGGILYFILHTYMYTLLQPTKILHITIGEMGRY